MLAETAHVSLTPGPAVAGTCDLCATPAGSLVAALVVQHPRGGTVRFDACDRCALAVRRLAAAAGGRAQFVVAPEVGSAHLPELPIAATRPVPAPPIAELIEERPGYLRDDQGRAYVVRLCGEPRADGTWTGWVEFAPLDGAPVRRTGSETTQSSRDQIAYWASGLEPLYFEGAFRRAQPIPAPA